MENTIQKVADILEANDGREGRPNYLHLHWHKSYTGTTHPYL